MPTEISINNRPPTMQEFCSILERSTLAKRRPMHEPETIRGMVERANLWATAWSGAVLVGVARSITDFARCCYLADLAVDLAFQKKGLGRKLIAATQAALPPSCGIVLLAAPDAVGYYSKIGFQPHPSAWVWQRPSSE